MKESPNTNVDIPDVVFEIRQKFGISQEELARRLGVSFSTVNRWETGKSCPQKAGLVKIQRLYRKLSSAPPKTSMNVGRKKPIAFSFFSGAGGFHLGMERAGFKVVLASDIDKHAEATHRRNWPELPFLRTDIRTIGTSEVLALAGGRRPEVIFGGPPCQGFSTLGAKLSADPRNLLFDSFIRLVSELQPKCVVIENVKSMLTMYRGQFAEDVVKGFYDIGYRVFRKVLDAADYGAPQHRQRVFFLATRLDHKFAFPDPTHGNKPDLKPYETVGDWIGDLVDKYGGVQNHLPLRHSERVIRRYRLIPEGGRLPPPEELPDDIRRKNFGNTYKRLHRKQPSLTMVPGNNAFPVHPTLDRSLTPREAARLQTFPDKFVFEGDRRSQCILVGNAVPVVLAAAVGHEVRRHIAGKIIKENHSDLCITITTGSVRDEAAQQGKLRFDLLTEKTVENGFVDLFCGAGGFSLGFSRAGWQQLLGADYDHHVALAHRNNFPDEPFLEADLSQEECQDLAKAKINGYQPGLLVGGPPCQGFSIFGKRRFVNTRGYDPHNDPRNKLVFAFLRIAQITNPRWVVMENVPGFATLDSGFFIKAVLEELRGLGFKNVEARILNAAHYGVPQLRKRLVIVANRTGHIIPWPKQKFFEQPKDWQSPYRTVGEVISDLAADDSYDRFTCHAPMKHKPLLVERYKYIPEGGNLNVSALPEHLKKGYRTDRVKNYSHIFKRLHRGRPSITMVPGHNAFPIHPWLNRALTVREAARIQTFPDEVEFQGPRQEQCIQVGNAFPPLLAELLAKSIRKAEENGWEPDDVPPSAYYAIVERPEDYTCIL